MLITKTTSAGAGRKLRVALATLVPIIVFAVVELVVETLDVAPPVPPPLEIWNPVEDRRLGENVDTAFRFSPHWLWEPRPGATAFGDTINADGYRGPAAPIEKTPGRLRIATLGDSSTFGFGLLEQAAWPRQLETILRAQGIDVEVLNFGCVGYTLAQGTALYRGRVAAYAPDIVVCAFGACNDQFAAASARSDAEKILFLSEPTERLSKFFTRYATYRWIQSLRAPAAALEGQVLAKARVPPTEFTAIYALLESVLERDSARLIIVSPPRRIDGERSYPTTLEYTNALVGLAAQLQVPLCDVRDVFRTTDRVTSGDESSNYDKHVASALFLDQWHPTAMGHRLYAETVAATIEAMGVVESAKK